jgi:hypothetical protein
MNTPNTAPTFGQSFHQLFTTRTTSLDAYAPLRQLESYQTARAKFDELRTSIAADNHTITAAEVEELLNAYVAVQSYTEQYTYRLGFRDGLSVYEPEFMTAGIV